MLGLEVRVELVVILEIPFLFVAGLVDTVLLLYVLLVLELVVARPRFTVLGLGVASAVVTFLLDRTTARSPLPAVCVYLTWTLP